MCNYITPVSYTHLDVYKRQVIYIPEVEDMFASITSVVPMQLLSYHVAKMRGCDIDKPRNLAKSVTVE